MNIVIFIVIVVMNIVIINKTISEVMCGMFVIVYKISSKETAERVIMIELFVIYLVFYSL